MAAQRPGRPVRLGVNGPKGAPILLEAKTGRQGEPSFKSFQLGEPRWGVGKFRFGPRRKIPVEYAPRNPSS